MSDKVYYDESCYVCSLEINAVRSRGEACGIEFIDISADDFDGNVKDFEKETTKRQSKRNSEAATHRQRETARQR